MRHGLVLKNVSKIYRTRSGSRRVLDNVNLSVGYGEKIGILGANGAGKSTLIRLISGVEQPTAGFLQRDMRISWPLAFGGGFQGSLTGMDNIKFICRVYGAEFHRAMKYVEEFSELGIYLREPVKKYSSGMRSRLAFGISMAIEFDCFLIDEIVAVGDARFQAKSNVELFEKRKDRSLIMVSHLEHHIRQYCERVCVLSGGSLIEFSTVDEAYAFYNSNMLS